MHIRSVAGWVGRPQTDTWTTTTRLHVNQSDGRTDSAKNVAPSRGTRARMVERARRPQWIIGIGKFHKMRESAWPFERRVDGLGCFAETLFDRRPTTLSLSALSLKENHPRRPTPWLTHSPVRISESRFDLKIDLTLKTGMMWREVARAAVKIEGQFTPQLKQPDFGRFQPSVRFTAMAAEHTSHRSGGEMGLTKRRGKERSNNGL